MNEPGYDDLIRGGLVLDSTGKCFAAYNGSPSILYVNGVKSERGHYRVWISNMQKAIRRGKLDDAVTSMIECVETGDAFRTNVINRLCKVIVSEDIGLANPDLAIWCAGIARKQAQKTLTQDDLLELVYRLTLSEKSRLVDNLYCKFHTKTTVPFEEAYDHLIQAIEQKELPDLICYLNHCVESSSSIKETIVLSTPFGAIRKRQLIYRVWKYVLDHAERYQEHIQALLYLYSQQEGNSGRKLNLIQACLLIIYSEELNTKDSVVYTKGSLVWKTNQEIWPMSASYDMHSIANAEQLKRGRTFFFQFGTRLSPITSQEWLRDLEYTVYPII